MMALRKSLLRKSLQAVVYDLDGGTYTGVGVHLTVATA
jgi:hypothetical protein